jgi:class 3 adenylate cyclase/pimeloyl-ACP methyl ester carboxylesterase
LSSEHVERRLAAILAADVAGSCRLIGIDEEGTLAQLKALRKSLVDPKIAEHRGRIVKNTGDGALVEFASVVDAVRCADEIQRSVAEQNTDVPQDKRIEFRIGIHVGDIIIEENDIFGDGVNIAVRLEGIAEPGGVSISDDVHRQVRGKVDFAFEDIGAQTLRNIAEPIRVWRIEINSLTTPKVPCHPSRRQEITFCRTKDGINLAVACVGHGMPLVSIPTWLNHLEYDWQNPGRVPLWRFLADRFRLIRYDGRGFGLSDRDVTEISLATFERDLEAVVDALHLRRYALLGISQGVGTAIAHAARYPDRVTRMVVIGGFALGRNKRGSTKDIELGKALIAVMREGWVNENSAFLRMFSSVFFPSASPEQIKWYADLLRISTSAENAVRNHGGIDEIDIVDLLPKVSAPTLVLHSRHDNLVPFDEGRRIATSIPNAKFVTLDSENHVPIAGEPAWPRFIGEIEAFLSAV